MTCIATVTVLMVEVAAIVRRDSYFSWKISTVVLEQQQVWNCETNDHWAGASLSVLQLGRDSSSFSSFFPSHWDYISFFQFFYEVIKILPILLGRSEHKLVCAPIKPRLPSSFSYFFLFHWLSISPHLLSDWHGKEF